MAKKISVEIQAGFYNTFANQKSSVPHALAEFIDNALQSYRDHSQELHMSAYGYKPYVSIEINWEPITKTATSIVVRDNAYGMDLKNFLASLQPGNKPKDNTGLHEFGMGLKSASLWLGNKYTITTKAYNDSFVRSATFDVEEVTANNLKEIDYTELPAESEEHYTILSIENLTQNAPKERSLKSIISEIASIYRVVLRTNELSISINGSPVFFEEYEPLRAAFVKTPAGKEIIWRKSIDFKFQKYRAKGFLALLKDIDSNKNGLVIFRRGRAIMGSEDGQRIYPKCLFGSPGTFRYKRLYGELELEGFEVSYNKNAILNQEDLNTLYENLVPEIRQPELDFFTQANDYRVGQIKKAVATIVKKHADGKKKYEQPINLEISSQVLTDTPPPVYKTSTESILNEIDEPFIINNEEYKLKVLFDQEGDELCTINVSRLDSEKIIICNINVAHDFFERFGRPTSGNIALIKAIVLARVATFLTPDKSAKGMFNFFNNFINQIKL